MKKLFAMLVVASVAVVACHSKKPAPTPPADQTQERKEDATGGARYGGRAPAASKTPEPTPH